MTAGRPLSAEYSKQLGFSFNTRLGRNLKLLRNAVLHQDFDCTLIVDGKEGSGKSVLAMQIAVFMDVDREFDHEKQLCFTPEQFTDAVRTLKKGKAIVWDEARRGVNRRRSMDNVNLDITDMLAECRQRNLFMILVMPAFYDMDLNVAMHRTRTLIHVWYTWDLSNPLKPLKRGYFRLYNEDGKAELYTNKLWRQKYKYPYLKNLSFDATFSKHYVMDQDVYLERKRESEGYWQSKDRVNPASVGAVLIQLRDANLLMNGWRAKASELFGVTPDTVKTWLRKAKAKKELSEAAS